MQNILFFLQNFFANYFIMFKKYFAMLYIKAFSDIVLVSLFTAICVIMNIEILKQFKRYVFRKDYQLDSMNTTNMR